MSSTEQPQEEGTERNPVEAPQEERREQSPLPATPEKGRNLLNRLYEGLYKIPGVNKRVGKMEIAYHQYWADREENATVGLKEKMDKLAIKVDAFDQSKKEMEALIEKLKSENMSGSEQLQLKLRDLDRDKEKVLAEKDRVQSAFEARENRTKIFTNERDRVADKLIGRYNEKIEPMERELESLQTGRDQLELDSASLEIKHKAEGRRLNDIRERKNTMEESLRLAGVSEKEIKGMTAVLEEQLVRGFENTRAQKETLAGRRREINKQIAAIDARANPYRDSREEFVRIKERRPIQMGVETRKRGSGNRQQEDIRPRTRELAPDSETREPRERRAVETKETQSEIPQIGELISGWNDHLQEKYGDEAAAARVDEEDFLTVTRLSREIGVDQEDFREVMETYYQFRKMPADRLDDLDEFFQNRKEKPQA